jgi:Mn-dependent DtxR family transcriptional regulator
MVNKKEFYTVRGYQIKENSKRLTSSMEDYLEMIYRMSQYDKYIRINQLANKLNVQPSSVTKTVQKLKKLGLIKYEKYSAVELTSEGEAIGSYLLKRHNTIELFLTFIGVEQDMLLIETEILEHGISVSTLEKIDLLNKFLNNEDIINKYNTFKHRNKNSKH